MAANNSGKLSKSVLKLLPVVALFPALALAGLIGWSILSFTLFSQPSDQPQTAETRDARWEQDIDFLRKELPERHVDPFYVTGEEEWRTEAQELRASVPESTDRELYFEMSRLVALLGDGHTSLSASTGTFSDQAELVYPLDVRWFDDGPFVARASEEYQQAIGAEVVAVGGVPVDEVVERAGLARAFDYENPYGRRAEAEIALTYPLLLEAAGITQSLDEATYELQTPEGESLTVPVESAPGSDIGFVGPDLEDMPLYWRGVIEDRIVWYEHLEDENAVYVQYNDALGNPLEAINTMTEALQLARSEEAGKLVFDVRNNTGGSSFPFLLIRQRMGEEPLGESGEVYGIMSRYTFSSGFDIITDLKKVNGATIAGQPAGTRPNFFGNVTSMELPNSGFTINYPTTHSDNFPEMGDARIYEPDLEASFNSEDFFEGRDPYLQSVLDSEASE